MVEEPPRFEQKISAIMTGIGSNCNNLLCVIVIAARNKITVILVNEHRQYECQSHKHHKNFCGIISDCFCNGQTKPGEKSGNCHSFDHDHHAKDVK